MSSFENNDKILKRLKLNEVDDCLKFPKYFEFETINMCNSRCVMCTVEKWYEGKPNKRIMSDEVFQKFADEVKNYSGWIENIYLCRNGEPILDKSIATKIKTLKNYGIKHVSISTNASLIDNTMAVKLIDSGLNEIMMSIDSNKKDIFEKIRVGLKFDDVFNNILQFIDLRNKYKKDLKIRVRMVIQDSNRNEIDEWMSFWKSKTNPSTDRVEAMSDHSWGRNRPSENFLLYSENSPCVSPFGTMVVLYDGSVPMCSPDYNGFCLMGNITQSSVKEIWNSHKFNELRKIHLSGNKSEVALCKNCFYWDRKNIT